MLEVGAILVRIFLCSFHLAIINKLNLYFMKRFLVLAICCAVVAIVSCVKDEPAGAGKAKVAFESPMLYSNLEGKASVAGEIGTVYPTAESFRIFAVQHENTFTSWSDADLCAFNGCVVSYDADLNAWAPKNAQGGYYYWEDGMKLSFAAVSPADLELDASVVPAYGNEGLSLENFQIQDSPAKQYDLLYSQISVNNSFTSMQIGSTAFYNGIPLLFKHALSAVRFSLKKDDTVAEEVVLTGLKVKGAAKKGSFNENVTAVASSAPEWTVDYSATADYTAFSGSKEFEVQAAMVGSTLLLMPQDLDDCLVLEVSYTVGGVAKTSEIVLNEYPKAVPGVLPIDEWSIGNRYTYCLTYGRASHMQDIIFFSPGTEGWEDADVIEVVL